jgi:hypothetical protein
MNILDHINAGHYPRDEKGRALVPTRRGETATIYATDHPGRYPLAGRINDMCMQPATWTAEGDNKGWGCQPHDLLPPAPRKVEVKAWGVFHGSTMQGAFGSEQLARNMARDWMANWKQKATVVELTGSYEEDWK